MAIRSFNRIIPEETDWRNMRRSVDSGTVLAFDTNDGAYRFFYDDIGIVLPLAHRLNGKHGVRGADVFNPDTSTGVTALSFASISFDAIARHFAYNGVRVAVVKPIPANEGGKAIAFKVERTIC